MQTKLSEILSALLYTFCGKSQKEAGSQESMETLTVCQNMGLVMLMCGIFFGTKNEVKIYCGEQ